MKLKQRQRGLTFFGLLFVGIFLAFAGVTLAQVVPTYIEYMAIQKAVAEGLWWHHGSRGTHNLRQGGPDR